MKFYSRRKKVKQEHTYLKMTLLLVRDWDGFQTAMRGTRQRSDRRGK
jgi:hypothetical protein